MHSTIAVKPETLDLLRHVKEEVEAESFDEVIRKLVLHMKRPKKSMFGVLKGVKAKFVREELDRFD
ncbi:hypothetical protein HY489_00835 [Candidatus Woesearchaeota archaeon]|nr:hypothetical protein [Candidatus Woesearchaeota archaeon]